MKKVLLILIGGILLANNYKTYKIIEMISEMRNKHVKFLPIGFYNIFPVNIDKQIDIKKYIQEQTLTITLKAIANHRAYINDKWYKKGDKIQNLIIKEITNDCVYFISKEIKNKSFSVCLSPNLIKVGK